MIKRFLMRSSKQSVSAERFGEYGEKGSSLSEGNAMVFPLELAQVPEEEKMKDLKYLYPLEVSELSEMVMNVCDQMEYEEVRCTTGIRIKLRWGAWRQESAVITAVRRIVLTGNGCGRW